MTEYFPKLYEPFSGDVSVKLDLSNFVAKADFEGAAGIDQPNLAANSDLARLNAEVDKIDVGKLRTVSVDLSKLSNLVNNDVVKKIVYNKLVTKVYAIDISRFALKLSMTRINQVQKRKSMTLTRKYLILVGLLKKRIITPKQVFFNWDSLRTRLNRHCKAWSYKKKKHRKLKYTINRCTLILDLKPFRSYVKGKHLQPENFRVQLCEERNC